MIIDKEIDSQLGSENGLQNTHLGSIHSGPAMVCLRLGASICNCQFLSRLSAATASHSDNAALGLDIRSRKLFDWQLFLSPVKLF